MIAFLTAPLAKWAIIAAVGLALTGGLYWQIRHNGSLATERDNAIAAAKANAEEADRQKRYATEAAKANAAKDAAIADERKRSTDFQRRLHALQSHCQVNPDLGALINERLRGAGDPVPEAGPAK